MKSTLMTLAMLLGATHGVSSYGANPRPTGRAAKSPELQQQLIAAAKAKRERRAAKRCQTKYLKGGVDYVGPSQSEKWTKCGPSDLNRVLNCPSSVGGV